MSAELIRTSLRRASIGLSALMLMTFVLSARHFSQSIFPPKLSLETAVEKALADNPQTRKTEAEEKIAEAKIAESKTGKKPFVQFTQSLTRSNNPVFVFGSLLEQGRFGASNFAIDSLNDPGGLFNFRSQINAQMPIFDQRQTRSRVTQAEIGKRQVEFQAEAVRQRLRFEVIRTYYAGVLGTEMLKVSRGAVRSAEANLKKAQDLADVGMTTSADYLAADVELASVRQQQLEAENNLVITLAALNIALGDNPEFERELTGELTEKYFPVEDQGQLIKLALENRPEYRQAELAVEKSREQTRAIKNQKLPQVGAFGNFGYSSPYIANGSTDYTVGVNLSYTVFDAGRGARVEQATLGETVAELERENLANQIKLEVIRAFQSYKTARAKIQVSVKAIAQAEEALRIIQDRYNSGLTTFNEVLRAEAALVQSKHNLLTARFEYLVSNASVLLATGRLTGVREFE